MSVSEVSILNLPEEVLVQIFENLSTPTLLRGVALTCRSWYWIVTRESELGRIVKRLDVDRNLLGNDSECLETVSEIIGQHFAARIIELENFDKNLSKSVMQGATL